MCRCWRCTSCLYPNQLPTVICSATTHQILCLIFRVHAVLLPRVNQDALTVWWIRCCCGALSQNWLGSSSPMLKNWHYPRANRNGNELIATASIAVNQILWQWIPWCSVGALHRWQQKANPLLQMWLENHHSLRRPLLRCDPGTHHTWSNKRVPLVE